MAAIIPEAAHCLLLRLHMHLSRNQVLAAIGTDNLAVHIRVAGNLTSRCLQFHDALYLVKCPPVDDRHVVIHDLVGRNILSIVPDALVRFKINADPFLKDHVPGIPFIFQDALHRGFRPFAISGGRDIQRVQFNHNRRKRSAFPVKVEDRPDDFAFIGLDHCLALLVKPVAVKS